MWSVGNAINGAAGKLCTAPIIGGAVKNPVFMALFVTAIVVIILFAMYYTPIKQAGWRRIMRASVFIFIALAGLLFIHHYAVTQSAKQTAAVVGRGELFGGIEESRRMDGGYRVPVGGLSYDSAGEEEEGGYDVRRSRDAPPYRDNAPPYRDNAPRDRDNAPRDRPRPDNLQYDPPMQVAAETESGYDPITTPFHFRPRGETPAGQRLSSGHRSRHHHH